jgi:hypothetical protein
MLTVASSLTSTTQNANSTSKIDIVVPSTQAPPTLSRIPGAGADYIVAVDPDFDAPIEFGA